MSSNFKPLGIAAAVAVASAGYANVASAQSIDAANLGDLALVPYYTVQENWITGIHIVNTSPNTQVVKFRFRRATDSLDALDFNVVMSPYDVYAGFLSDDDGTISWSADDTSCTVPATSGGKLTMPPIYRDGADTGYVEVIAMGQPINETTPIAVAAKHVAGEPRDCVAVRSNFFADGELGGARGVASYFETRQVDPDGNATVDYTGDNEYDDSVDALKVSYFIRDNDSGVEFGNNAVHVKGFLTQASITNQQYGVLSGDLDGFDFPDLDGGVPTAGPMGDGSMAERGRYNLLRGGSVLGVDRLINEWTANTANGAALDWVVTMPGQYVMLDLPQYLKSSTFTDGVGPWFPTVSEDGGLNPNPDCPRGAIGGDTGGDDPVDHCDYRDIPVSAAITPYNREEATIVPEEGDLVVSPAPPGTINVLRLPKEVNVISFGPDQSVLNSTDVRLNADLGQPFGWLQLAVSSADDNVGVCDWDVAGDVDFPNYSAAAGAALTKTCSAASGNVPMIGFAAWARSVAANPDASYGRIVEHSFMSAGS